MTDNMAQFSLDAALRSPRSIHGRGGEGVRADHAPCRQRSAVLVCRPCVDPRLAEQKAIFSDYMDVSIRKRVNLSAQGHA